MAIAERLALLRRLRNDLADELTALGLPSRREETLEALVPRVLLALEGTGEGFAAALKDVWDVPGGFFSAGESASLAGMADISRAVRVTALTVTAAGEGAGALTAAGAGWSVSRTGGALTARYSPGGVILPASLQAALARLALTGDGVTPVTASVTLSGLGASGAVYPAAGAASLICAYAATWRLLDLIRPTWADLEGRTWDAVERLSKP